MALHAAAIPSGYRPGAIFWKNLWLAGKELGSVRWWRHGANQLKASVDRVGSPRTCNELHIPCTAHAQLPCEIRCYCAFPVALSAS